AAGRADAAARHAEHVTGGRLRARVQAVEGVLRSSRRVGPPAGPAVDIGEIAEGPSRPQELDPCPPALAPVHLGDVFGWGAPDEEMGLGAVAGGPGRVAGEGVVV